MLTILSVSHDPRRQSPLWLIRDLNTVSGRSRHPRSVGFTPGSGRIAATQRNDVMCQTATSSMHFAPTKKPPGGDSNSNPMTVDQAVFNAGLELRR